MKQGKIVKIRVQKKEKKKEEIKEEIELIKKQGYAIDDEEIELGLFCIAAPIFDHRGKVIGSISISGSKNRFDQEKRKQSIKIIKETSQKISKELNKNKK